MTDEEQTTPAFDLRWHVYMRVKAARKIPRVVHLLQQRLHHPIELLSFAPCAHSSRLVYGELRTPLNVTEIGAAMFETLYLAQRLGKRW